MVITACPHTGEPFREVAAGWAHTLARTSSGAVFSWGFNALGSLGLGDNRTRFFPEHVTLASGGHSDSACGNDSDGAGRSCGEHIVSDDNKKNRRSNNAVVEDDTAITVVKIHASGNFSGALTSDGQLLTWGCTRRYRQGHPKNNEQRSGPEDNHSDDDTGAFSPRRLERLAPMRVTDFALCSAGGVALVPLRVSSIYPVSGPMEVGCKVAIHGDAFWDSPDIIVRFAPVSQRVGHKPIATRSAVGIYVIREGERDEDFSGNGSHDGRCEFIECTAPCFASPEEVFVEVSLTLQQCVLIVNQMAAPCVASRISFAK